MLKMFRLLLAVLVLVAFGMVASGIAEDFFVAKDKAGKMAVVDKKPDDPASVVKGPFPTKAEAETALKAAAKAAKPKLPSEGC
jgi:hypothetical protein